MTALTRREARQQWRNSIKEAWNNRCAYCGKPPIDDESITIDHVAPRSKGGRRSHFKRASQPAAEVQPEEVKRRLGRLVPHAAVLLHRTASGGSVSGSLETGAFFGPFDEEDRKIVGRTYSTASTRLA